MSDRTCQQWALGHRHVPMNCVFLFPRILLNRYPQGMFSFHYSVHPSLMSFLERINPCTITIQTEIFLLPQVGIIDAAKPFHVDNWPVATLPNICCFLAGIYIFIHMHNKQQIYQKSSHIWLFLGSKLPCLFQTILSAIYCYLWRREGQNHTLQFTCTCMLLFCCVFYKHRTRIVIILVSLNLNLYYNLSLFIIMFILKIFMYYNSVNLCNSTFWSPRQMWIKTISISINNFNFKISKNNYYVFKSSVRSYPCHLVLTYTSVIMKLFLCSWNPYLIPCVYWNCIKDWIL